MSEGVLLKNLWNRFCPFRFAVVGAWNTVFSYCIFSVLYFCIGGGWGDLAVQLMAGVLGITQAYLTHRLLTYKSNGVWWKEYCRFYVVYGGQLLLQAALFFALTTWLGYNGYLVQFATTVLLTIISYWAHKNYTFSHQ